MTAWLRQRGSVDALARLDQLVRRGQRTDWPNRGEGPERRVVDERGVR